MLVLGSPTGGPEPHPSLSQAPLTLPTSDSPHPWHPSSPARPVFMPGQDIHPGSGPGHPQWRPRAGHDTGRPSIRPDSGRGKHGFCNSGVRKELFPAIPPARSMRDACVSNSPCRTQGQPRAALDSAKTTAAQLCVPEASAMGVHVCACTHACACMPFWVCVCAFLGVVDAGTCGAGTRPPDGCTEPSRGCQPGGKPCYLKVISRSQPADESEDVAGIPRAPALPVAAGGSFSGQGSFTGHHRPGP